VRVFAFTSVYLKEEKPTQAVETPYKLRKVSYLVLSTVKPLYQQKKRHSER
jgi:hypothetical protein